MSAAPDVSRLRWRCRRGMQELDLLLDRFLRVGFPRASSGEQHAFARLLELPDPELAGYLLGGVSPADPELARLAQRIVAAQL